MRGTRGEPPTPFRIGRLCLVALLAPWPDAARADWWSEHVDMHGYFETRIYARSPDFRFEDAAISSQRSELNLEAGVRLYEGDDWQIGFHSVLRPSYDAVYETSSDLWGDSARGPDVSQLSPDLGASVAPRAIRGRSFANDGSCLLGEFCLANSDIGSLFSGKDEPSQIIDDVVFFGATTAPWRPDKGEKLGGNADLFTYTDYLDSPFREPLATARLGAIAAGLPPPLDILVGAQVPAFVANGTAALASSIASASRGPDTPLNFRSGALGDISSLEQAPFDVNRNENELAFDCFDNAHEWCFLREAYFDFGWRNTQLRVGRQQVVWGKTDAFRLQDNLMPVDLGQRNIFPSLEDRRIPRLSADLIQGFGDLGPLKDFSVEGLWIFDRFLPSQLGQCGEPYAYTQACQGRADAAGHGLFNFALAGVKERPWTFENTQPGARIEFRIPEPSISFSFSAFYGFQTVPVSRFENPYNASNPNPAALLFLQGLGVGPLVDAANQNTITPTPSVWQTGFDPYDPAQIDQANQALLGAWRRLFDGASPLGVCAALEGPALTQCVSPIASLSLPWTASEAVLEYPRVLTLGASADYQVPRIDTVVRLEMAYDVQRKINNTEELDGISTSDVFLASVGLDRSTFIPFLNPDRSALLTGQTFVEHIIDYDDGSRRSGMVPFETNVISTFQIQNYWRNDSITLTNLFAYDWKALAFAYAPTLRWILGQHLFWEVGLIVLHGDGKHPLNIRDVCPGGNITNACISEPASWNSGQWQMLNGDLQRASQAPWWSRQSFADRFMDKRDEIWTGFTYQF